MDIVKLDHNEKMNVAEEIERYKESKDRQDLLDGGRETSNVVRKLAEAILDREGFTWKDFNALYLTTIWYGRYKTETKKGLIQELNIDSDRKKEIIQSISDKVGCWGSGTFTFQYVLDTKEKLESVEHLLITLVKNNDAKVLDGAIQNFANFADNNIGRIQSGVLSPILYCLHPTKYPVINSRSRKNLEEIFHVPLTGRIRNYLDEKKYFDFFRNEFAFEKDFRDVDGYLGVWIPEGLPEVEGESKKAKVIPPEDYLRKYLAENHHLIEPGLELILENEEIAEGMRTRPDLVFKDKNGNFLIVETKKNRVSREVVGQISEYMGQVSIAYAKEGQKVRGLIIAFEEGIDNSLRYAVAPHNNIELKSYEINFKLKRS